MMSRSSGSLQFRSNLYDFYDLLDDGENLYMAPEAANNLPYNEKVDIYSFGVILRLLLTGVAAAPPPVQGEEEGEEEEGTMVDGPLSDNLKLSDIEPERVIITTPMQLLIG